MNTDLLYLSLLSSEVQLLSELISSVEKEADLNRTLLPALVGQVPLECLQSLAAWAGYTEGEPPIGWTIEAGPGPSKASLWAAALRNEVPCPPMGQPGEPKFLTQDGLYCVRARENALKLSLTLTFEEELDEQYHSGQAHDHSYTNEVIPPSHRSASLYNLAPWGRSPISTVEQEKWIDRVKHISDDTRGWLLLGPPGTSKTTYVAAYLKDQITLRLAESTLVRRSDERHELCVMRVKAKQWLDEMAAWETRDWEDSSICPPAVTVGRIQEMSEAFDLRPILWLEEIDRFSRTDKRMNLLNSLVDCIYELNGMIIVTTNLTVSQLEKQIDGATLRRITGANDDPADFKVWDFHKLVRIR